MPTHASYEDEPRLGLRLQCHPRVVRGEVLGPGAPSIQSRRHVGSRRGIWDVDPRVASKLYGVLNFLEQGVYGRIRAGRLAGLKDCQQERDTVITAALQTCFETVRALLKLKRQRVVEVLPAPCARVVAASDAAEDTPGQGTGGFLLVWSDNTEVHEAFEASTPPELYRLFTPGTHKIAQLELSMVLFAFINRPDRFRGRRGVFYIDNLAALMALIRHRSDAPHLEHLSRIIHAAVFSLQRWIYWE